VNSLGVATLAVAASHTFERPGSTNRTRHPTEVSWSQVATGFVGLAWMPGIIPLRGTSQAHLNNAEAVLEPAGTVSAGGTHHGLMTGGWVKQNAGQTTEWHPFSDPFNAITARDTTAMVVIPGIDQYRSAPTYVLEPMAAALTHMRQALTVAPPGDADVIPIDEVRFRMLQPDPELRRVMAFPHDFILFGTKTRITAGLGNAVTPPVADWITSRVFRTLDAKEAA
jgi:DNA (cytosine-5)-methyltransferase 1